LKTAAIKGDGRSIHIDRCGASDNLAIKNFFGDGIDISGTAASNTIQNTQIYSNLDDGISFTATGTGNVIKGNFIGTNTAFANLGNTDDGIWVDVANTSTSILTIGGTTAGDENYIAWQDGSSDAGIRVDNGAPKIIGNFIGVTGSNTNNLGNYFGIDLATGSDAVQIGGTAAGEGNTIGFGTYGIWDASLNNTHTIQKNYIGTDASWRNLGIAVGIRYLAVGGTATIGGASAGNWICWNDDTNDVGIYVTDGSPRIEGNYIGTNSDGDALGNVYGIQMTAGADDVKIGSGTDATKANVISRNTTGISSTSTATGITIDKNYIGTNPANITHSWPNTGDGIQTTAAGGTITIGNGVVIGPNTGYGINMPSGTPIVTLTGTVDVNDDVNFAAGTVNLGSADLQLTTNWSAWAATVNMDTSTVTFDGSGLQTIVADTFVNLTIVNTAGTPSDTVDVDAAA